jgi:hypothetical protein
MPDQETRIELELRRWAVHSIEGRLVYIEKIRAPVRFGTREPFVWVDSILDPGTALTVIPPSVWQRFPSEIRWPDAATVAALPSWLRVFGSAAGGAVGCRIGFVPIQIYSKTYRNYFDTEIIAMLADRDVNLQRPLLGLGGGVLSGRVFHLDYDREEAWLEKRSAET